MSASLRVARLDSAGLKPLADDQNQLFQSHAALSRVIRRHLPPITASLLAAPRAIADSTEIEWSSDLAGQPTPLTALPSAEQEAVRRVLADRLASLAKLANELPHIDPDAASLTETLLQALSYPGEQYVYVVGGQPVITFWGHTGTRRYGHPMVAATLAIPEVAADSEGTTAPAATRPGRFNRWLLALPALLLALLAAFAWWHWSEEQIQSAELLAQLEAARGDCTHLWELKGRIKQVDPDGTRYPELRSGVEAELALCQVAEEFAQKLAAARGDCAQFAALHQSLAGYETARPPLNAIRTRLEAELQTCQSAARLEQALAAAEGDCERLAALEATLVDQDLQQAPLRPIRDRLEQALKQCRLANDLSQQLAAADGDCEKLEDLQRAMAAHDTGVAPLRTLQEQLDAQWEVCQLAAQMEKERVAAAGDCQRLATLDNTMRGYDTEAAPLRVIRERLEAEMQRCSVVAEFEQELTEAKEDCKRLAGLKEKLQGYDHNAQLRTISNRLDEKLEECQQTAVLEQRLAAAGTDCQKLKQLNQNLPAQDDNTRLRTIRNRLNSALQRCARPEVPEPRPEARPPPAPDSRPPPKPEPATLEKHPVDPLKLCPGERPVELAPDLVIVFDASGSMAQKIPGNSQIERQLQTQGLVGQLLGRAVQEMMGANLPRRIDVAKQATSQIVNELPQDVDVGLVLVENCPQARPIGFFGPQQRGRLLRRINAIEPVRKTPLGSGIQKAGAMVDGINAPGIIVVVSDGQESCGLNPCQVARRLSRQKPRLIINVVDIMGTGAGTCLAQATHGRVYKATNAQEFNAMLHRATQEARGPAQCKRRGQED